MQIGAILLISFIVSMTLVLNIRDKINRIFSVAAICSFFLVITLVAELPETEVTRGSTLFIASVSLVGVVFVVIVLINVLIKNLGKKSENKNDEEKDKSL